MIFIDRSIPRSVADALKAVRPDGDVAWLEDRFAHDTPDADWLSRAGDEGWLVVSRDKRIRHRPGLRNAAIQHGVGMFIFAQTSRDPTRWEYFKLMGQCLDEMERLFEVTPRPFIFLISQNGSFRQLDLSRFGTSPSS